MNNVKGKNGSCREQIQQNVYDIVNKWPAFLFCDSLTAINANNNLQTLHIDAFKIEVFPKTIIFYK